MKVCWNITSKCNKNCKYCFKFDKEDLSLEDNKKILNTLINRKVKRITWTGGEPFLYKDLKELLKISKENNIINHVNTNATLLTENNLKENIENIDRLIISLDFINDDLNEEFGIGKEYFKHVSSLLGKIKEVNPKIEIRINTVVFKNNIDLLEDLYNELLKYDIDYWKLIRFFPIRGKAIEENGLGITDEEFTKLREKFGNRKQNFEIVLNGETELKERHIIVLSSGRLVYSEGGEDIETDDKLI